MSPTWYVLRSKPRKEEFLLGQLVSNGFDAYCPFVRVAVVNPRARHTAPYFPGYVFLNADLSQKKASRLHWMPGTTGFVSFDGSPACVPDGFIPILRQRMKAFEQAGGELFHNLKIGDPVRVKEGPFAGYEAIFDACLPGSERVRIMLKLLQKRQLPVELPAAYIQQVERH